MTQTTQLKQRFRSSIRRGTGEAHLLMQEYPKIDFSNDIIKASITNFAYDGQCESSRAIYLYELISLSCNQAKIREAILKALATEQNDTWSLTQLFELAKIFAKNGDDEARNAIYNRFLTNPINGADWTGYSEILELDGFEGLKFIADKKGDNKILIDLAKRFRSEHVIESLAISYIEIYKSNATVECKEPLEAVYEKLTCAIHRKDIVKILIENNVISDKIKSEIKFDCDDETRLLIRQ